ncbi:putative kinesin light chain, partial [Hyaloscypha finlandica]
LGAEYPSTLDTVSNLGILYADQGKLAEAEKIYEQTLQGYEMALGAKHPSTLDIVNNLPIVYVNQGRHGEAEKMYERELQKAEDLLTSLLKQLSQELSAIPERMITRNASTVPTVILLATFMRPLRL